MDGWFVVLGLLEWWIAGRLLRQRHMHQRDWRLRVIRKPPFELDGHPPLLML